MDYDAKYNEYKGYFNGELEKFCENKLDCRPQILSDSLKYSLMLGGKRIRPVLMLAVGEILGKKKEELINFAIALELIHTYSLIHDDLPAMDNDDFRRGKPSNHKAFGEDNAILAGDGLLNTAYSLLFDECFKSSEHISAAKCICECAGIFGMIAGQSADLLNENGKANSEEELKFIYEHKTGKLILAPVIVPSILSSGRYFPELKSFALDLGTLFQLTDDILDVEGEFENLGKTVGKDEKEGKLTAVSLLGLDRAKLGVDIIADRCLTSLEGLDGDTSFLKELVNRMRTRIN